MTSDMTATQQAISDECDALKALLLAKNKAYGNAALDPVRCWSKAPVDEQIRVRLDDKLSRFMRGEAAGEDVEWGLMGYLVLLRVSRRLALDEAHRKKLADRAKTAAAPLTGDALNAARRSAACAEASADLADAEARLTRIDADVAAAGGVATSPLARAEAHADKARAEARIVRMEAVAYAEAQMRRSVSAPQGSGGKENKGGK